MTKSDINSDNNSVSSVEVTNSPAINSALELRTKSQNDLTLVLLVGETMNRQYEPLPWGW